MARKPAEFNASTMADIAFLLLIFFLVTTTMDVDTGIIRRLPPPVDPEVDPPKVKERNIFNVLVNKNDRLLVDGKPGDINLLKNQAKQFLKNPLNLQNLPQKRIENIPLLGGDFEISRGIISLKNDRGTSYDMYIQVQNELTRAINELRDELSVMAFGIHFSDLKDKGYIDAIQKAVPVSISEAEPEDVGGN